MKTVLIGLILTFSTTNLFADMSDSKSVDPTPQALELLLVKNTAQPNNCVNEGGSCTGAVPCCDSNNVFCVRRICQRVP